MSPRKKTIPNEPPEVAAEPDAHRGVPLIEAVILSMGKPAIAPISEKAASAMTLADGGPLPPSLRRFLTFHGPDRGFPGNWTSKGSESSIEAVDIETLIEMAYAEDEDFLRYWDLSGIRDKLTGMCHPLNFDAPLSFLYVGVADEWGEYPILTLLDHDDCLDVVVDYPGIDVYLACLARFIPPPSYFGGIVENPIYRPMMEAAIHASFDTAPDLRDKQYLFSIERLDE